MTLKSDVAAFRRGILDGRKSARMCCAVSMPLAGYLEFCGIPCVLVHGEVIDNNHTWIKLADGRIIDATADQFKNPDGTRMPQVYIGELPDWYRESPNSKRGELFK